MIHLCTCTGGSASSFKNHTHPEGSKTCKSCGGKLSVDVRGALSGSMASSLELQLAGLNWKTPSKGSPSNTRRTRTSRTGGNKKNILTKSLKESEDATDKEVKKTEDVPPSESEKLGVSILGRRFSETLGSVPLKKRRFPLFRSPSPPPKPSHHLDGSDQIQQRQSPSHEEDDASNAKHRHLNIGNELHQNKISGDEKSNLKDLNVKHCDVADFSGISILAAAACDNNIGGDIMNAKTSPSKERSTKGDDLKSAESLCLHKEREDQMHRKDLDGTNDTLKLTVASGKASDGIKLDDSSHNSSGPSESDPDRTRRLGSSSHDKLSWDLNVVMDVWDSHNDGVLDSESQLTSNIIGEAGFHDEKLGAAETFQNQAVFGDRNYVLETANSRDLSDLHDVKCALEESKMEDRPDFSGGSSIPDEPERKDGNAMRQEKFELQNASVPTVDAIVLSRGSSVIVSALKKEKVDDCPASSRLLVETELSTSLLSCESASFDRTHCAIEQNSIMDDENRTAESKAYLYHSVVHSSTTIVQNHTPSCTDPGNDKADWCSVSNHVDETTSDVLVVANSKNDLMDTSALSGGSPQDDVLNGINRDFSDKLEEVCVAPLLPNPQPSQGLPVHEASPCPGQYETTVANSNTEDNKCSMPFDGTLNSTRADPVVDVVSDIPVCDSGPMKSCEIDAPSSDNALKSQGVVKGSADGYANSPGHLTLDDHFDCDYYSDDSQLDTNQPLEKVDFLDDEEDQYEDGEWRESGLDTWGDNGSEGGETERVDYGSDNREADGLEPSIDSPASVPLRVVDRAEGMINADYDHKDGAQEDKEPQDAASQSLQKCLLTTDVSDPGSPKRQVDVEIKTLETDATNASEPGTVGNKRHSWDQNAYRESGNLYNSGMKSSGWDRFPRDFSGSAKASFAGDSSRKVVSSSSMRDTPRTERPKSSDMKNREDKSYLRTTSSNNRNGLNPRLARDAGAPTSIGRDRSSLLVHGRGRNDRWVDSSNRDGHTNLDSQGYCRPVGFTPPASRNAAAATVAKLESNGFIVAPDGTIIKAGIMGPGRQAPQLPTKASNHSLLVKGSSSTRDGSYSTQLGVDISRETGSGRYINIGRDRACRYGPETTNIVHKERYHRPISDEGIETSSPLHHRSARREQCLSPRRRPLRRSRSRSLSRSRTRSPHMYGSPRGRNGGPGLHPRSRSPNFKPEDSIIHKPRSPHRRSGIVKGTVGYAQSSRNHTSPPNDLRWFDGRKDLPVQFREHEQHRFSERSPPRRVLSQRHRLDPVDSAGRVKPNMFSRSMHPGNFAEFVGPDRRRSRYNDDRRGYDDRFEVLNSERQNGIDGNMKQRLRYDDAEDGYVAHYPRPRSSEFQRRGVSPRGFDRLGVNQLEGSPPRAKEEKVHGRFGSEGKQDSGFDSFGVRHYNDDTTPRRRPS